MGWVDDADSLKVVVFRCGFLVVAVIVDEDVVNTAVFIVLAGGELFDK